MKKKRNTYKTFVYSYKDWKDMLEQNLPPPPPIDIFSYYDPFHQTRVCKGGNTFFLNSDATIETQILHGVQFKFRNWVPINVSFVIGEPDERGVIHIEIIKHSRSERGEEE